jgi:hypothetical protein
MDPSWGTFPRDEAVLAKKSWQVAARPAPVFSAALIMVLATGFRAWRSQGGADAGGHHEPPTPGKTRGGQGRAPPWRRKHRPVRPRLPLCRLVAHPWHAIRVTEAMRLRALQDVRGLRAQAETPHGADAVIAAPTARRARDEHRLRAGEICRQQHAGLVRRREQCTRNAAPRCTQHAGCVSWSAGRRPRR